MHEEQKLLADEIEKLRYSDQPDEAIALCQQAMSQFSTNSFFPRLQGDICRQYGRFPQAIQAYLKMLMLLRPNQFSIFVTVYRNLEKDAPEEVICSFLDGIKELISSARLPKELQKNLYTLLGPRLVIDSDFIFFVEQATDDRNISLIKNRVDKWESTQDIAKIEALATLKLSTERNSNSKGIDSFLIQKLEKLKKYDLALAMIEKTQKPYQNKLILAAMLRICRKKGDYSFVEKELNINEEFISISDFNLQYELVYYFQITGSNDGLEKILKRMRSESATSSIPIARTLYNFYLSLNRFEDAQSVYKHIQYLVFHQDSK